MENYEELYNKAVTLMESALKKYEEMDFDGASKDRQLANETFDELEKVGKSEEYNTSMLYGENRNFGVIYNVIESNLKNLYLKKDKNNAINELYNIIKENKVIKKQFLTYQNLSECKYDNVEKYVQYAVRLAPYIKKDVIKENNNKLIGFIRKNKLNEFVEVSDDKMKLYGAIEFVMTNKPSMVNFDRHSLNEKVIIDYLSNNKNKTYKSNLEEDIDTMDEKYKELLTNEEKEFILDNIDLTENEKKNKFNEYKQEVVSLINEKIESCSDNQAEYNGWCGIKNKISNKTYNNNNFITDIAEMTEIYNTLISE